MLRLTAETASEAFESAITAAVTQERSSLLDSDSEIHQTADAPEQFFTSETENATLSFAEFPENITSAGDVEMFPRMDESGWKLRKRFDSLKLIKNHSHELLSTLCVLNF